MKRSILLILPLLLTIGCEKSQVINYEFQEQQSQVEKVMAILRQIASEPEKASPMIDSQIKTIHQISPFRICLTITD